MAHNTDGKAGGARKDKKVGQVPFAVRRIPPAGEGHAEDKPADDVRTEDVRADDVRPGCVVVPADDIAAPGDVPDTSNGDEPAGHDDAEVPTARVPFITPPTPPPIQPPMPMPTLMPTPAIAATGGLSHYDAVVLAYRDVIDEVASILRVGLSALIYCDRTLNEFLVRAILERAGRRAQLKAPPAEGGNNNNWFFYAGDLQFLRASVNQEQQADEVLVLNNLDLLVGTPAGYAPSDYSREMVHLLHQKSVMTILAFAEKSWAIPDAIAGRFEVRQTIEGLPPRVKDADGHESPVGAVLLTAEEQARIEDYQPERLYKEVAGMNAVQLRSAVKYIMRQNGPGESIPFERIASSLRTFKASRSTSVETPNVSFEDIGGYEDVKASIKRSLRFMEDDGLEKDARRRQVIPRGFILHGEPGTGKTLLAKAIANELKANLLVVSGPEVINMYLGESERHIREIFAEARRSAPAVLIFDEFDAIAGQRGGRADSASRAQNAIVAQLLTEMDGFRPNVRMLVIGTTNRIDIIDRALLRPTRFQSIYIDLPDPPARRAIAGLHAKYFGISVADALMNQIVKSTNTFNGDEIASLFRDVYAARHAANGDQAIAGKSDAFLFGELIADIRQRLEEEHRQTSRREELGRPSANRVADVTRGSASRRYEVPPQA